MPVRVKCPNCEGELQAPSKYRGAKVKCPACKEPLIVPALKGEAKSTAASPTPSPPPLPLGPLPMSVRTEPGTIKTLFPNDTSDQLGPLNCDACGTAMLDNRCPSCEIPVAKQVIEQFAAFDSPLPETEANVEKRYPNLRKYIEIIHGIGVVLFFVSLLCIILFAANAFADSGPEAVVFIVFVGLVGLAPSYIFYITTVSTAELLLVMLDIEENTRKIASRGEKK